MEVKPVPQKNTFELQHKLYKAGHSYEQNQSIYQCLNFIISQTTKGEIWHKLDFGHKYSIDANGFLNKVKTPRQISRDIMATANFRKADIASKARFIVTGGGTIIDTSLLSK